MRYYLKTKITTFAVTLFERMECQLFCLCQRPDALSAKRLLYFVTVLNDRHLLQVGMKGAVGCPVRERNAMTESSGLTAMSTFSHFLELPFLPDDTGLSF